MSNSTNMNKDREQLLFTIKGTLKDYNDSLVFSKDATSRNEEMRGFIDQYNNLFTDDISVDDILCVSDVINESPHRHITSEEPIKKSFKSFEM